MSRRALRPAAAVALAAVLVGCVQIRSELTVTEDGLVEGFAEASFAAAELEEQGVDPDDVLTEFPLDELIATPGVSDDNRIEQVFEQGGDVIVSLRFQGAEATDIEVFGESHPFTRTDDGGFAFDLPVDTDRFETGATLQLQILFPFEVIGTDGDLEGSTVSWDIAAGTGEQRLTATTNAELYLSAPAGVGWLGVGFVLAAAFVLVGGFVGWHLSRRRDAP